jgi:hypothetical protein
VDQDYIERLYKTWTLMTDPIRPSETELIEMRRRMDVFTRPHTLVLGVTPELVDMVLMAGVEKPVVFEVRGEAIEALKRFARQDWSRVEFIIDDWRNFRPELAGKFDVVIGHGTFLFLAYPEEWVTTLGYFCRYLADDGRLIVRHFVLPPEGHPLEPNYRRILEAFERSSEGRGREERLRRFIEAVTDIRSSAILAATGDDGRVNHSSMSTSMGWVTEDLRRRYEGEYIWEMMGPEFTDTMPKGYEEVWPLAAPTWNHTEDFLRKSGFAVDVRFIGNRPAEGVFCVFTAGRGLLDER